MTSTHHRRISAAAYQALRDALPAIVWYKRTFARYIRTALREHAELLVGIDLYAMKREIADELVDRLVKHEDLYQDATLQLMMEIASTARFPELEKHEDSETLLKKAPEAVAVLRHQTEAHEQLVIDRERAAAAKTSYVQQAESLRPFADELLLNDPRRESHRHPLVPV